MRWLEKLWLNALATTALIFGRKRRALQIYREIAALDPSDDTAASSVGNLLAELGDAPAAIEAFRALVARSPNNAEAWFNLGFLLDQREDNVEAERCFRTAVELKPKLDRAWYGLGLVLIREGRLQEAVAALKENTKLQPFSPYGWYQLAMTYHHLGASGDAWRVYEHLRTFEPRYAATLKRDMEATAPRARTGLSTPPSLSAKEAIATTR
jgi:Flp pilus assembly protein TadD